MAAYEQLKLFVLSQVGERLTSLRAPPVTDT